MKKFITITLLSLFTFAQSQTNAKPPKGFKITYTRSSNGKLIENQDAILVFTNPTETLVTSEKMNLGKAEFPFEQTLINRSENKIVQVTQLKKDKSVTTVDSLSSAKQDFEFLDETKIIMGYKCQKAKTIINSNTFEFWYTNELQVKGAPTTLGQNIGLVLEMIRNRNFVISATKIEKIKSVSPSFELQKSTTKSPILDGLTYKDLVWKSRFTTIKIFENEVINYSEETKSNDSILRFANGTIILKKVTFPEIKKGDLIFLDLTEQSNGDAYDRTGSVFVIPQDKKQSFLDGLQNGAKTLPIYENGNGKKYQGVVATTEFSPIIELMRFFTPFGIKQYNYIQLKDKTWHEIVPYRMEITDLKSNISGKTVYVGTFIGNYDKGGHKISMNITINPNESTLDNNNISIPLFNTTNVMEMANQEYATMFNHEKGLEVTFTLDKEIKNTKLRYITTGHGGWENGDEFVPKRNTIVLNGKEVFSFIPWRQDCGGYRLFNPASGNFNDGLSSSDLSRSNWCPGTATNPIYIELGDLKAGTHKIQVKIPQGENEGGSFSSWNVSGVLLGE
ncbi:GLPGLI family protein [Flavobacterium aquaticum]|uniref:GLPGLI family protein n=1 Tax=Flavobacterium aquaticum TaxID=1236486 RepID=A0A327YIV0_9FLAO|nr:PNGase F N-terminal domain-containing protein [Flavobacterium aquaticum]RAK20136.1 GLPGLI family protein [Flavobacterium aquaticum]